MAIVPLATENISKPLKSQSTTLILLALFGAIFFYQVSLKHEFNRLIYEFGAIPAVLNGERQLAPELQILPSQFSVFSSIFLHADWAHLVGNMLFLWVFGGSVETSMGHLRFFLFFLSCGAIATLAHVGAASNSVVPVVGASGAISGVLGAYFLLFPRTRILTLVFRIIIRLPSYIVLGLWVGFQIFSGWASSESEGSSTIAWWSHIGGFSAGLLLLFLFKRRNIKILAK
jgi:membrane associated rhomboid family serine protease